MAPTPLFKLTPVSRAAEKVVADPQNKDYVTKGGYSQALAIGCIESNVGSDVAHPTVTLATFGSSGSADIYIDSDEVSRIQGSFEVDRKSGVITLVNRGRRSSVKLLGKYSEAFSPEEPPRAVLLPRLNTKFELGNKTKYRFEIIWVQKAEERDVVLELAKAAIFGPRIRCKRHAPDRAASKYLKSVVASEAGSFANSPTPWISDMQHVNISKLGQGGYGQVHKAVDLQTCQLVAVKSIMTGGRDNSFLAALHKEVDLLSQVPHPRIIKFIASKGWDIGAVEFFMELKDGSLFTLAQRLPGRLPQEQIFDIYYLAFKHALEGLEYIHRKTIIHRDIKPDNILYSIEPSGRYSFVLADFGLWSYEDTITNSTGTHEYMAPECFKFNTTKTEKVDIWALFVTMLEIHDLRAFDQARNKIFRQSGIQNGFRKLLQAARRSYPDTRWESYGDMLADTPEKRPSARDLLGRFHGARADDERNYRRDMEMKLQEERDEKTKLERERIIKEDQRCRQHAKSKYPPQVPNPSTYYPKYSEDKAGRSKSYTTYHEQQPPQAGIPGVRYVPRPAPAPPSRPSPLPRTANHGEKRREESHFHPNMTTTFEHAAPRREKDVKYTYAEAPKVSHYTTTSYTYSTPSRETTSSTAYTYDDPHLENIDMKNVLPQHDHYREPRRRDEPRRHHDRSNEGGSQQKEARGKHRGHYSEINSEEERVRSRLGGFSFHKRN